MSKKDTATNCYPRLFLSAKDVVETTGLSRTSIWRLCRSGDFPQPVTLSPNRIAWSQKELLEWAGSRASADASQSINENESE